MKMDKTYRPTDTLIELGVMQHALKMQRIWKSQIQIVIHNYYLAKGPGSFSWHLFNITLLYKKKFLSLILKKKEGKFHSYKRVTTLNNYKMKGSDNILALPFTT
jgi:hypothetical protein